MIAVGGETFVKLKIEGVEPSGTSFEAPINPESYTHNFTVSYNEDKKALGDAGQETKFETMIPQTVSFDLILDDTGIIYDYEEANNILAQINKLKTVVYNFVGEEHQPPIVKLVWEKNFKNNEQDFKCVLTSMDISFTLFAPSGRPLRAKIGLKFKESKTNEEIQKDSSKSSPDMTHYRLVCAGDTLPRLCAEIYKDARYYLEVARVNGLSSFRNLKPGTELVFPPIKN